MSREKKKAANIMAELGGELMKCEVRNRYNQFRSSSPIAKRICEFENPECWRSEHEISRVDRAESPTNLFAYVSDSSEHRSWERRAEEVNLNIREAEVSFDRDFSYDCVRNLTNATDELDAMHPVLAHRIVHEAELRDESGRGSVCDSSVCRQPVNWSQDLEPAEGAPINRLQTSDFGISIFDMDEVNDIISVFTKGRAKKLVSKHSITPNKFRQKNGKPNYKPKNPNSKKNSQKRLPLPDNLDNNIQTCKSDTIESSNNLAVSSIRAGDTSSAVSSIRAGIPDERSQFNKESDFRKKSLRVLNSNCRGWWSKHETVEAILNNNEINVACLTETHTQGSRFPQVKGYRTFFRNRKVRQKGGIALLIKDEDARYATKLCEGRDENEYLCVKLTNTQPEVVFIAYYGNQTNSFTGGAAQVRTHLHELFTVAKEHADKGAQVNLLGDFNVHVGADMLPKNSIIMDKNGRVFLDWVKEAGLTFMNNLSDNPITFVNRSAKENTEPKRCVLDFVLTNKPETISEFKTDSENENKREFTPYSVRTKKGVTSRVFADHMAVMYSTEVGWKDRVMHEKVVVWNYRAPGGDLKFDIATSNKFNFLHNKIVRESDINIVIKAFQQALTKSKFQSYGKRSYTDQKVKVINDELLWAQRLKDIDRLQKQFESEKEPVQIYKTRAAIIRGQTDNQTVAVEDEVTGELIEDLDDIIDNAIAYNVRNMEKVPPADDEVKQLMEKKAEIIDQMLDDHNVAEFPSELPWSIFMKVLKKVTKQKKAVFRDFIKSGREFKYALYLLMNRMYVNEEIPAQSMLTFLTKLWKKKGPRSKLSSNRFIHMKDAFSKFFEKCIVQIVADKIDQATPQMQAGSRPGRSTRDQLIKLVVMQKYYEKSQLPLPLLFVDVASCFDKIQLSDVIFDAIEAGGDRKAIRVIRQFSDITEIRIKGDLRGKDRQGVGAIVKGTTGQGSNFAPPSIGLTTSKAVQSQFGGDYSQLAKIGNVTSQPSLYVDDIKAMAKDEEGVRGASQKIGRALQTICLQSHPDKSEIVVSGRIKKAEAMRNNLKAEPALMQGNPIKISEEATYLGMKVSQVGYRESVHLTARHRVTKAWERVKGIKTVINDYRMNKVGWLKAGVTLIRAEVLPSLTYSCEVWVDMYEYTRKMIEHEYKAIIYTTLDIPTTTKWTSVLADTGLPGIMSVIDKLRVNFFNHIMWGKGDKAAKELLLEEKLLLGDTSSLGLMDDICMKYNIPPVSVHELHKPLVKSRIKVVDQMNNWISNLMSSATKNVGLNMIRISTNFHRLSKRESQAIIAYNAGSLRLRTAWGDYYKDKNCLDPFCYGRDTLNHLKVCPFYETKWQDKFYSDIKLLAKWLGDIDRERRRRWKDEKLF